MIEDLITIEEGETFAKTLLVIFMAMGALCSVFLFVIIGIFYLLIK